MLRPGKPGVQEKSWPIETFFHKIVMLRNRLRTLEQQVNASDLPDDQKVKIQSYITGCYGSLTSFNVLFADEDDRFVGAASRLALARSRRARPPPSGLARSPSNHLVLREEAVPAAPLPTSVLCSGQL